MEFQSFENGTKLIYRPTQTTITAETYFRTDFTTHKRITVYKMPDGSIVAYTDSSTGLLTMSAKFYELYKDEPELTLIQQDVGNYNPQTYVLSEDF